jgi:hypothetical protein
MKIAASGSKMAQSIHVKSCTSLLNVRQVRPWPVDLRDDAPKRA